jgi:ubiquinol-cytochrome c reductase cytochrome b subunit
MSAGPRTPYQNPVIEFIDSRLPIFTLMNREYGVFPTPRNFNYFWNFGAIAMFMLVTMIVTGLFLAMNYNASTVGAFDSVERIMRDVNYGWLIRYIHMNGASFFFIAVYIHIFRGMYYGSYKAPREILWILGVVIFLLMMATAFMGYVLPWGQMSFWGATVITNLFSAIPVVGDSIVTLLWGGFSVDNPTLNRFFALHFVLPFVIFAVVFLHIWALHVTGSNNPTGLDVKGPQDTLPFHPYYTMKDTFGLLVFLVIYAAFIFFMPNALGHPDNYIEANPMVTPPHIVPEWYFLPFYAILRSFTFNINPLIVLGLVGVGFYVFRTLYARTPSAFNSPKNLVLLGAGGLLAALGIVGALTPHFGIPLTGLSLMDAKLVGVLAMFGSIAVLFVMPWLDWHPVRSARYRPLYRLALILFVVMVFVLGYCGASVADAKIFAFEMPRMLFSDAAFATIVEGGKASDYILFKFIADDHGHHSVLFMFTSTHLSLLATLYYFGFFLVVLPYLSRHERARPLPNSIHQAVLKEE